MLKNIIKIVSTIVLFFVLSACQTSTLSKAKKGDVQAQLELGKAYYYGEDVTIDYGKSLKWFTEAAEQGSPIAMEILARRYYTGANGVEQNFNNAYQWAKKAAEKGRVGAMTILGVMYCKGQGVTQDDRSCSHWYLNAANGGDVNSQLAIAKHYLLGKGVKKNGETSLDWYYKAMNNGAPDARTELCNAVDYIKENQGIVTKYDDLCSF